VVTAANTPTAITYTNDEYSNGIVFSGSQLTVQHTGIYEIAYSLQIEHTGGGGADVNIWLRKNGTNIIRTDSILGLRSQSAKQLPFVSIIDSANANDYYEVYFQANASDVQVTAVAATGTIPAAPSIITNIKQIGVAVGTTSGTSGSSGSSGTSGGTGSSGLSGSDGTSGSSGTSGGTGSSGSAGSSGTSGTSGTTGTSGSSGTAGTTGTSGTSATSGTSGTTGTSGTSATSGSTGTSGSSGTSGNATTSARAVQTFTSTSGQTTFTVTNGYNLGMVDVFVNGVKFVNGTDFTATDGTTVNMAAGLAAGNIVEIDNLLTAYLPTNALRTITTFTATAGQSAFSVSYTQGLIDVFYNGSCLAQSEYLAINGTSITLVTACQVNDIVVVYAYSYSVGAYSGIGGSGTATQVAYFTSSAAISSSSNLYWDNTNTRLGIGNSSPSYTLDVSGTGRFTSTLLVSGASTLSSTLQVGGTTSSTVTIGDAVGSATDSNIRLRTGSTKYAWLIASQNNVAGFEITPSTAVGGTTFSTPALTILPAGNVGIGTSSPGRLLEVNGDTTLQGNNYINTAKMIQWEGGSYWSFRVISSAATFQLYQGSTGATPITVDTNGRVSITGTTYPLNVYNSVNASGTGVMVTTLGSNANNTSSYHYIATTGTADKYYLYGNGTYTTVSDERLKKNITKVTDTYLDKVLGLNIVNYNWNDQEDNSPLEFGMIAQDVEKVIPSIVHEGREQEDGNIYKGIQASVLPYILIKAIQEQQIQIQNLQEQINAK
jgi:hypothetical protein